MHVEFRKLGEEVLDKGGFVVDTEEAKVTVLQVRK